MTSKVKSLITLSIVLLAGILLSIGTYMIFNPIKEQRAKTETLSVLENYFSGVTDYEANQLETLQKVEILRSVRVFKGETPQGYLYEANINNEFGNMKVRLSVDVKDVIQTIEFLEMNQTMYQAQTQAMLETYALTKLSADIFDGAAGATSISKNDLSHLMSMVGLHHDSTDKFEVIEPYRDFYGEDYIISNTENLNESDATIKVETIEGLGVVYTITKSGIYQTGSIEKKSITMIVALDLNNEILGVLLPVELYNHTKGNFMVSALAFAESFVGDNLADITDGNTGASGDGSAHNSRNLIEDMMLTIQSIHIHIPAKDTRYVEFYGEDYEILTTENLNQNGATIKVETIKDKGTVYTITKSGIYRTGNAEEKSITMIVALDQNNEILGVLLPEELYNHTKGNFMVNALAFAESFAGENLANLTDGNAGATGDGSAHNSRSLIEDMMLIIQSIHIQALPIDTRYVEFYGENYEILSTENLNQDGAAIKVELIKDKGTVYTITKSGIYRTGNAEERSITMIIVLDLNGEILGVLLPEDLYNHSKSNWIASALAFAESFAGENIANLTDGNAGATGDGSAHNSRSLIEDMMLIIQGVHLS